MAVLYISELGDRFPTDGAGNFPPGQAQMLPVGATAQGVTYTPATAASSAAFGANTKLIRVTPDTACTVRIGASPQTAVATDHRIAANTSVFFAVTPGHLISVF